MNAYKPQVELAIIEGKEYAPGVAITTYNCQLFTHWALDLTNPVTTGGIYCRLKDVLSIIDSATIMLERDVNGDWACKVYWTVVSDDDPHIAPSGCTRNLGLFTPPP